MQEVALYNILKRQTYITATLVKKQQLSALAPGTLRYLKVNQHFVQNRQHIYGKIPVFGNI